MNVSKNVSRIAGITPITQKRQDFSNLKSKSTSLSKKIKSRISDKLKKFSCMQKKNGNPDKSKINKKITALSQRSAIASHNILQVLKARGNLADKKLSLNEYQYINAQVKNAIDIEFQDHEEHLKADQKKEIAADLATAIWGQLREEYPKVVESVDFSEIGAHRSEWKKDYASQDFGELNFTENNKCQVTDANDTEELELILQVLNTEMAILPPSLPATQLDPIPDPDDPQYQSDLEEENATESSSEGQSKPNTQPTPQPSFPAPPATQPTSPPQVPTPDPDKKTNPDEHVHGPGCGHDHPKPNKIQLKDQSGENLAELIDYGVTKKSNYIKAHVNDELKSTNDENIFVISAHLKSGKTELLTKQEFTKRDHIDGGHKRKVIFKKSETQTEINIKETGKEGDDKAHPVVSLKTNLRENDIPHAIYLQKNDGNMKIPAQTISVLPDYKTSTIEYAEKAYETMFLTVKFIKEIFASEATHKLELSIEDLPEPFVLNSQIAKLVCEKLGIELEIKPDVFKELPIPFCEEKTIKENLEFILKEVGKFQERINSESPENASLKNQLYQEKEYDLYSSQSQTNDNPTKKVTLSSPDAILKHFFYEDQLKANITEDDKTSLQKIATEQAFIEWFSTTAGSKAYAENTDLIQLKYLAKCLSENSESPKKYLFECKRDKKLPIIIKDNPELSHYLTGLAHNMTNESTLEMPNDQTNMESYKEKYLKGKIYPSQVMESPELLWLSLKEDYIPPPPLPPPPSAQTLNLSALFK